MLEWKVDIFVSYFLEDFYNSQRAPYFFPAMIASQSSHWPPLQL